MTEAPWVAYLTVFLLQFKLISADWEHRDLTGGDSATYYWSAIRLHDTGIVDLEWSPLYQVYLAAVMLLSSDAYFVTILHRWLIILGGALLLLWVLRRILPHWVAWLLTAWWAVLSSNYNVMYEVHSFIMLPLLVALGLLAANPPRWRRGIAVGVLVLSGLLIRNEFFLLALIVLLACAVAEARTLAASAGQRARVAFRSILSYGTPGLVTALVLVSFNAHGLVQFPDLLVQSEPKHTLNVCQVYAFSYQQRYSDWTKSPWLDCQELMRRDFGEPQPSALTALRENPSAMLEHFWWNSALAPAGLQVLLFNSTSGTVSPDFSPVVTSSDQALVLSIVLLSVLILGGICLLVDRHYWWTTWVRPNVWTWLCFVGVVCVAIPVIVLERPRPEYLFSLGVFLLAVAGMAAAALARRFSGMLHWGPIALVVAVCLLVVTPSYLADQTTSGRRLQLDTYQRLAPFANLLRRQDVVFLGGGLAQIARYYLGGSGEAGFSPTLAGFDYGVLQDYAPTQPFQKFLDDKGINIVYLDSGAIAQLGNAPGARDFLLTPELTGWNPIASAVDNDGPWRLLKKTYLPAVLRDLNPGENDIVPAAATRALRTQATLPDEGLFIGYGWYPLESADGERFRWVNTDAQVVVSHQGAEPKRVQLDVAPGPATLGQPMQLQVLDDHGAVILNQAIAGRTKVSFAVPSDGTSGLRVFRLRAPPGIAGLGNDPRTLNFRVFDVSWLT